MEKDSPPRKEATRGHPTLHLTAAFPVPPETRPRGSKGSAAPGAEQGPSAAPGLRGHLKRSAGGWLASGAVPGILEGPSPCFGGF